VRGLSAAAALAALALAACAEPKEPKPEPPAEPPAALAPAVPAIDERTAQLVAAAIARTREPEVYDGSYQRIPYPMGDVAEDRGVCTDLVIRSYRALGVDLQQLVHEDMAREFAAYPQYWGLPGPDPNIDHRRVPNLETYFRRAGAALPISQDPAAYRAGDLVSWRLPGNLPHIGIVTDQRTPDGKRPIVAHNIGNGPELEDMLFAFPITGHFRYALP
jgi:uncharacterized protein YijF (DUF1287 family)